MKELISKKNPRKVQILTDDEYENLKKLGLANRWVARDIQPIKNILITPKVEIKTKKKDD